MASNFPPMLGANLATAFVEGYTPDAAETFGPNVLIFFDTADREIKVTGADPALILGLSLGSAASKTIDPSGKIPVHVLNENDVIGLSSATTPAETHVGEDYGLVYSTEGWPKVDTTDTTNVRVLVIRVDIANGIFYCRFLATNLQFNAITDVDT